MKNKTLVRKDTLYKLNNPRLDRAKPPSHIKLKSNNEYFFSPLKREAIKQSKNAANELIIKSTIVKCFFYIVR